MISPTNFRDLVSGRRTGAAAEALRGVLRAVSVPYGWAVERRNRRYDRGVAEIHRAAVPVISVGNLTVGGTGKTPMVEWIVRYLSGQKLRVAILSRGYGAAAGSANDEAMELELALPGVPHLQNPDRARAAQRAVEEFDAQVLVLDDGFQHRRLGRDLDIVLLDASEPFGFDRLLPAGTLREPAAGLSRAQVVVLSRAGMLDAAGREAIRRRALELSPAAVWCEVDHQPVELIDAQGGARSLDALAGRRVAAFCGIGNPAGFRHTLDALGCNVAAWREFPDHHAYSTADLDQLAAGSSESHAELALCTRKDLVKLRAATLGGAPLYAVTVGLQFLYGEAELEETLAPLAEAAKSNFRRRD